MSEPPRIEIVNSDGGVWVRRADGAMARPITLHDQLLVALLAELRETNALLRAARAYEALSAKAEG